MNSLTLYFAWERGALSAVGDGEKNGPIWTRYCNHTCVINVDCNCANFVGNKLSFAVEKDVGSAVSNCSIFVMLRKKW